MKKHPNSEIMGQGFKCSSCGADYNYFFNFCPDCGKQHKSMSGKCGSKYSPFHYPIGLKEDEV